MQAAGGDLRANPRERPESFTAAQLRVLLRAIVNLDPYTFADDLSEDIADESDHRSAEEVLLATIISTTDNKLTRFALRLALAGHVGIPRENELDFLSEDEPVFAPPQEKAKAKKTRKTRFLCPRHKRKSKRP